jgi:hypothetical protein
MRIVLVRNLAKISETQGSAERHPADRHCRAGFLERDKPLLDEVAGQQSTLTLLRVPGGSELDTTSGRLRPLTWHKESISVWQYPKRGFSRANSTSRVRKVSSLRLL